MKMARYLNMGFIFFLFIIFLDRFHEIYTTIFFFFIAHLVFQNLNKQAYDLAKALLKRTAQAIEPYITNVSKRDLL